MQRIYKRPEGKAIVDRVFGDDKKGIFDDNQHEDFFDEIGKLLYSPDIKDSGREKFEDYDQVDKELGDF